MNPLVKDMLESAHSHDIELRFLEEIFEDDCKCEGIEHGNLECVKTVSALYRNCKYQQLACSTRVAYVESYIQERGSNYCRYCLRLGKECWTITPI